MLKVHFHNCREIRMGSPYDICDLRASGPWIPPELKAPRDWVKVKGRSADGRYLALAFWETPGNQPGFHVLLLDNAAQRVGLSEGLPGCCEGLGFDAGFLHWRAYPDLHGRLELISLL